MDPCGIKKLFYKTLLKYFFKKQKNNISIINYILSLLNNRQKLEQSFAFYFSSSFSVGQYLSQLFTAMNKQ
jgi:hypothetical protein